MEIGGKGWVGSWKPEGVIAHNSVVLARALGKASAHLAGAIKHDLSKPGPTKTHRAGTVLETGEVVGPSKPGEPPRKRTGALRASIRNEKVSPDGLLWRVGTNLKYGFYLEFGTKRGLEPRPWLRPALQRESRRMQLIALSELKSQRTRGRL